MAQLTLVIGNKNYSSWSLRPWLLLRQAEIPFEELRIQLYRPETRDRILEHSPAGQVPVLHDDEVTVWDSLAICEYLAERFPEASAWPADKARRALARSISGEMHAGFSALRQELPMNCRLHLENYPLSEDVEQDVQRVRAIWRDCRQRYGADGPWLLGDFSIADAMFAPVVLRFYSYGVELDGPELAYRDHVLGQPAIRDWVAGAQEEAALEGEEVGEP